MPLRPPPRSSTALAAAMVATLIAAGAAATGAGSASASGTATQTVIVEFDGAAALERMGAQRTAELREPGASRALRADYGSLVNEIHDAQDAATGAARSAGISFGKVHRVTGALNAVVTNIDPTDVAALRAVPGVARVTLDTTFTATADSELTPTTQADVPETHASPLPARSAESASAPAPALPGTGVTVAILDTGIDYNLPDLGAGFGEGHLVVAGHDYINDDADPMDDHYHGTHVAGIVAGSGVDSVTGVAPGVELTAWKVLDDRGSGDLSGILLGLDAAIDPLGEHPADVVNMSLGGDGDGSDPLSMAANNATESGALVVAAAGNSGPSQGTIGSPAAAPRVLAVGASVTDYRSPTITLVTPSSRPVVTTTLSFSASAPTKTITAPVVDVAGGSESDFAAAGSVKGKAVVIDGSAAEDRGESAFAASLRAETLGAVTAFVTTRSLLEQGNDAGDGPVFRATSATAATTDVPSSGTGPLASGDDSRLDTLVAFGITASEYDTFAADVAGGSVAARVTSTDITDSIASFSSRGPTLHGEIKPEVVAPGYQVRSTVPFAQEIPGNAYRLSGTSMSTPFVAGIAAAVIESHPGIDPVNLRELLIGSAVPLQSKAADASPSLQGAGLLDLTTAVAAAVRSTPATLGFGLADPSAPESLDFTLSNPGDATVTGRLSVLPSAANKGTLVVPTRSFSIPAGSARTFAAVATASAGQAESEVSGEVEVTLSTGATVRIPYLQIVRRLDITSSPTPSTGHATIAVRSFLPLDAAPVLTITPESGKARTVKTTASSSLPGYYSAEVDQKAVGDYAIAARGRTDGTVITGVGSFEVIPSSVSDDTWQQFGRNATTQQIAVSPRVAGTAMQLSNTTPRPFATTDHGKTWTHTQSLPVADGSGTLVADPRKKGGFWYFINATSGGIVLDPSYTAKLLRTDDLGKTWRILPLPEKTVLAVASEGNRLVAITADGAEVSTDGGKSWHEAGSAWPSDYVTGAAIFDGDLFVSTLSEVTRIESIFGDPAEPTIVHTAETSITGISAGADFVVTGGQGIWLSTNGTKWKTASNDQDQSLYGLSVVGDDIVASGLHNNWVRSTNRGKTWESHEYPVVGPVGVQFTAWPDRSRSLLMSLPNAGLYSSTNDGKSFTRLGAASTNVYGVLATVDAAGKPTVIIADGLGVGSHSLTASKNLPDNIAEWGASGTEAIYNVESTDVAQDAVDRNTLWKTRRAPGGYKLQASTDAGASWKNTGPGGTSDVFDIEASETTGGYVVASASAAEERVLLVTHDSWATWKTLSHPVTVRTISIDPHDEERLWLAADEGLFVSEDGGRSIRLVADGEMSTVWVDPADPEHIVAGGLGLWTSHNGGETFVEANAGSAEMLVSSITSTTVKAAKGETKTVLFAGSTTFRPGPLWVSGRGVLASLDGGMNWEVVSAGIGTTSILSLDSSVDGKWLLAGTRQGGVYRASVAELVRTLG